MTRPLRLDARSAALLFTLALAACDGANPAPTPTPSGDDAGPCRIGTLGCACTAAGRCAVSREGNELVCDRDLCVPARCTAGESGCVCAAGECQSDTDACIDGICRPSACAPGELHCECADGLCGPELFCDRGLGGGTCVDHTGFPGGPCPESGLCREQSRCDARLQVCVPCAPGSEGCEPAGGRCNEGLELAAGRCVPPMARPPENPVCYTRCRDDLRTESGIRDCDTEGLMEGCVDGRTCVEGSCVAAGESPRSCAADVECPDFQSCIAGQCYSSCEADSECPTGRVCDRHVCRIPCERPAGERDLCPAGTFCSVEGAVGGVCREIVARGNDAMPTEVRASFTVDTETLTVSRLERSAYFEVTTDSALPETFTVRAVSHRAYDASGALIEEADARSGALAWLTLSSAGSTSSMGSLSITVPPGCGADCPAIEVRAPESMPGTGWARWEGTLEIVSPDLGARFVSISYSPRIDGRWTGSMFYFGNFGTDRLAEWRDSGHLDAADIVGNALIQRWGAYRRGALDGFEELGAVLTATRSGSWSFPNVRSACPGTATGGACYMYDDGSIGDGLRTFVPNLRAAPIPTGVTELPIALNLRTDGSDTRSFRGRIDSDVALHYPGNPEITLALEVDPSDPQHCATSQINGECVAFLTELEAEIVVGGRSLPSASGSCPTGTAPFAQPWLVPGFLDDTRVGANGGIDRVECRDGRVPYSGANAIQNRALTGANPILDGAHRRRSVRLLDGVLVGDDQLFVLFEERFQSHLDSRDSTTFTAYGYMLLRREAAALAASDYVASPPPQSAPAPLNVAPRCDPALLAEVLDPGERAELTGENVTRVVQRIIDGVRPNTTAYDASQIHYYCEDTGLFDGGRGSRGAPGDAPVACPPGSNVTYFAFREEWLTPAQLAALPCQAEYDGARGIRGTCGETLNEWREAGVEAIDFEPVWTCANGAAFCDRDRFDLRAQKRFYAAGDALFPSLEAAIADAFRYRIRFRTGEGRTLGFTPAVCDPVSDSVPYCYDPEEIEGLRDRVDCLMEVYRRFQGHDAVRAQVSAALSQRVIDARTPNQRVEDGFERLHAELLVMLGDEAYTTAFRSRFELAATTSATFEGERFEPDGIHLDGIAAREMESLYRALQYYDLAIERFFSLTPVIWTALARRDVGASAPAVVTPGLVTWYLERVVRASTQKARTYAAIAERYQTFHRTELARSVLERGYLAAYLESVLLTRVMHHVVESSDPSARDGVARATEDAELRWRVAMREMREVHASLTEDATVFGFPVDFVPIPVRDDGDFRASNIFEDAYRVADEVLGTARINEQTAITSARSFDTDAATFQAELRRLSQSYEERLGPLCGYFTGRDGHTYPAIERYAHQDDRATALGDPCGRMGNGEIHTEILELQGEMLARQGLLARIQHTYDAIHDEEERVGAQCGLIGGIAAFEYSQGSRVITMQDHVRELNLAMSMLDRVTQTSATLAGFAMCTTDACGRAAFAAIAYGSVAAGATAAVGLLTEQINQTERDIDTTNLETAHWRTLRQCDAAQIDSAPIVRARLREIMELRLEVQQQALKERTAQARIEQLVLQARRIQDEQREAESLQIAIAAAQNDPNLRVYRTDAILNAERSFEIALRYAYRATRVYEYYTSQSYPALEQLFLVRMISGGSYNLETYLLQLRDAFYTFEERYRAPALRVERVSLVDHILAIPYTDETGRELSPSERIARMHERLRDPRLLDANGHLTIPFRTRPEDLSPCTFNHKLQYVEISLIGGELGDDEADILLWQDGTGIVQTVDEGTAYYRFPPGVSVVNPYFGRNQIFDAAVYRRYELRDRPFLNTSWSLVLDQRDNVDNQDIPLENIDDIVLYAYYNDFTDPRSCRR